MLGTPAARSGGSGIAPWEGFNPKLQPFKASADQATVNIVNIMNIAERIGKVN